MNHLADAELQAWIDEELDPRDRTRVADHLASCGDCRQGLGELRAAADLFRDSLVLHDEGLGRATGDLQTRARGRIPRWVGRAAALTLLLGGAAVAAIVPGSPLRSLWFGESADSALVPPTDVGSTDSSLPAGASISVRPSDGALRVRVRDFPAGTRIRITPADGQVGVASLPDGEANARFVVAAGMLEVVGPGRDAAPASGDGVILQLPRELRSGVVEVDGDIVARVSGGRIVAQRQVSASGDGGVVIEVGG